MVNPLEETFPGLAKTAYRITSPRSKGYNCIAWALGDTGRWWWPVPPDVQEVDWPAGAAREETIAAFREVFLAYGYIECNGEELEAGFKKIALFADAGNIPLHAARQLGTGGWTSKLGELEDIKHELRDLEGTAYGSVVVIMKRLLAA